MWNDEQKHREHLGGWCQQSEYSNNNIILKTKSDDSEITKHL